MGETVAPRPEGTLWPGFSVRIINALLVRAADDPVRHGDGHDTMLPEKSRYLQANFLVEAHVGF